MYLANPLGLLGLLALPVIVLLHLYHRRFRPLLIGGLHLWGADAEVRQAGRRRDRLPITPSLLLELFAALLLSLILSQPRLNQSRGVEHLIVVLDNSASMQAGPPGQKTFREDAIDEIEHRFKSLPKGSVASLIITGRRPTLLAGPAAELSAARKALDAWMPNVPAHDFQGAWDLAEQLAEQGGRILFVTDHLPPRERCGPKIMETLSVGRPLENAALTAARWSFDATARKSRVYVRVANFGKRAADVKVFGKNGDRRLFERTVPLEAGADAALESEVPGGSGEIAVDILSKDDGLPTDNHVTLIEPKVRTVTVALTLPADHAAIPSLRRALAGIPDTQFGDEAQSRLVIGPPGNLPQSRNDLWWLGIGPLDPSEAARKKSKDLAGPFLLEKRHPLLEGVVLGGIVFGGVQPVTLDVTPLVSAGKQPILSRLNGTQTSAFVLDTDFARTNLPDSPDWPILVKNLVDLCRDSLPGLKRWNYRLNEEITFRSDRKANGKLIGSDPLVLIHNGKSRPLARTSVVEVPTLEETGIYEIRDGDKSIGRFAVNFYDPVESTLTSLGPGVRDAPTEVPPLSYQLGDPFSWLIAGGITVILITVIADWFVLKNVRRV
jgi:hypothetical protein